MIHGATDVPQDAVTSAVGDTVGEDQSRCGGALLAGAAAGSQHHLLDGEVEVSVVENGKGGYTFTNDKGVVYLAEFGVVFLMFVIGLEFNLNKLRAMRRLVMRHVCSNNQQAAASFIRAPQSLRPTHWARSRSAMW